MKKASKDWRISNGVALFEKVLPFSRESVYYLPAIGIIEMNGADWDSEMVNKSVSAHTSRELSVAWCAREKVCAEAFVEFAV